VRCLLRLNAPACEKTAKTGVRKAKASMCVRSPHSRDDEAYRVRGRRVRTKERRVNRAPGARTRVYVVAASVVRGDVARVAHQCASNELPPRTRVACAREMPEWRASAYRRRQRLY